MSFGKMTDLLKGIYRIYGDFAGGLDTACRKYCAHCCTVNVSITTLEGYYLIQGLEPHRRRHLLQSLERVADGERFRPQLTTNRIAELCRRGESIPEEDFTAENQKCPLLQQDACPVYLLRPFGCRCFVSKTPCRSSGAADVDEFVLSVNTLFLQTIEHLDKGGCTGNMVDVLLSLLSVDNRRDYRQGRLNCLSAGLITNAPLAVLMVPPEHRRRLQPIIAALNRL